MKTSKVAEVVGTKPWNDVTYHNLVMENGDKINIGKKKLLAVGDELNYEITGDGQQEYDKAKSVMVDRKPQGYSNMPFSGTNTKEEREKKIGIGHAINNAVSLYCAHGDALSLSNSVTDRECIKEYAKEIYRISEELNREL